MRPTIGMTMLALVFGASTLPAQRTPASAGDSDGKSPTVARVIGIAPGLGHMYAREPVRGLAVLGGMGGILVVGSLAMVGDCLGNGTTGDNECQSTDAIGNVTTVALLGLWGWSIYDAGRAAERTNARRSRTSLMIAPGSPMPARRGVHPVIRIGVSVATR
jgi:hypothetical protein